MAYIVLVGMMGCGKSTVGKLLAEDLDIAFLDTDMMVQYKLGRSISQIFNLYGEAAFRCHETDALRSITDGAGVVATGGGIVLKEENWAEFRRIGASVFLDADVEILKARLKASKRRRPLLETENWEQKLEEILETRRPLYEKADVKVPVFDQDFDEVVARIKAALS